MKKGRKALKALGVIPARGGSKGVPRKNLRMVGGEKLIAYSIRAARESSRLSHFLTTTDDREIAETARGLGSHTLIRPARLAGDDTPIVPVILHALRYAERKFKTAFDVVVLLQPTAPIRTGKDIDAVVDMLGEDPSVESIISVCSTGDAHPARMYRIDKAGCMESQCPDFEAVPRQALPELYHRNGALYAVRKPFLVKHESLMGSRKKAYIMPREYLANIDDERDLIIADKLIALWKRRRKQLCVE